jgi:hypothetical protein
MISTIQLSEKMKRELKSIKPNQSYEEIIADLVKQHKRLQVAEEMKEYGKKYGAEGLAEVKEWEVLDEPWD